MFRFCIFCQNRKTPLLELAAQLVFPFFSFLEREHMSFFLPFSQRGENFLSGEESSRASFLLLGHREAGRAAGGTIALLGPSSTTLVHKRANRRGLGRMPFGPDLPNLLIF